MTLKIKKTKAKRIAKKRITTVDIAQRLGINKSTVQNILNPRHSNHYSEKTRKQVFQIAREMGYQTSLLAHTIKQPLKQIGFVGSSAAHSENAFVREILKGMQPSAANENYMLMTSESNINLINIEQDALLDQWTKRTNKFIELVSAKILDGLIIDKSQFGNPQMELLENAKVSFVLVNGMLPNLTDPLHRRMYWISIDHFQGSQLAVEHLLAYGHKRIALIMPGISQFPIGKRPMMLSDRLKGYISALEAAGIKYDSSLVAECSLEEKTSVLTAIDKMLRLPSSPTAFFACDDSIAVLTINYLRERGIDVPREISVMGYGNLPLCQYMAVPKLTTVDVPWAKMGEIGLYTLAEILKDRPKINKELPHFNILKTRILEGASVSAPLKN